MEEEEGLSIYGEDKKGLPRTTGGRLGATDELIDRDNGWKTEQVFWKPFRKAKEGRIKGLSVCLSVCLTTDTEERSRNGDEMNGEADITSHNPSG